MNVVRPPLHLNECHFLDVTILIMKAKLFGKVNNAAIAMAMLSVEHLFNFEVSKQVDYFHVASKF